MTEAENLFTHIGIRFLHCSETIMLLSVAAERGVVAAEKDLAKINREFADSVLSGSELEGKNIAFAEALTQKNMNQAKASIEGACLVFAHSMLDGAAIDLSRVTALLAPEDWEQDVEKKQLPLADIRKAPYGELLGSVLEKHMNDLEKESLLRKIDRLFARCKPPDGGSVGEEYKYDSERIARLDQLRQQIVHGESLGQPIAGFKEELGYLLQTVIFLIHLVANKYDVEFDRSELLRLIPPGFLF